MTNWKRIIAAAGTAALLISNLGSISQLTFATEQTAQPVTSTDDIESDNGDESEDAELLLQGLKDAEEVDEADDGNNNNDESDDSDHKSEQGDPDDDTDIDEEDESSQEESDEGDDADEEQDPDVDIEEPASEEPASEEPTEEETVTDPEEEPKEYDLDDSLTIDLDVKESGNRDVKRNDNGDYLYSIDETASMTLKVSNPDDYALDESDDAVVRLYMQFTDTVSTDLDDEGADTAFRGKTKAPGTYAVSEDDDDSYTYSVYEIENGLYCYEFERPIDGDSYSVELTSTYKKGTDGGSNRIWMAVLSADDAKALDEAAAERAAEESDDEDADEDIDERTDNERVIGVADLPEDKDDIVTLRWADPNVPYPAFQNEQTMSDGTVITVDAPEGAFPEGIQLSLSVKDAEDYLDAIRAYTGDETLTAENWLAYDFDFYTDDEHHEIEPLSSIKVTFSNLTRLTELAEEAAAASAEVMDADDDIMLAGLDEDAGIALADLDEEAKTTDDEATAETGEDESSTAVTVYHIPNIDDNKNAEDVADTVTKTTVTSVDPEAGTIEIETDQFSTQLLDLDDGIMLTATATSTTTVDHIDIGISANASVTINGQQQTVNVTLERSDFTSGNVTVSAAFQNGSGTPYFTTNNFNNITTSSGTSGITQYRVGGTYRTGTLSNPAVYTFTLKKDVTFTVDGEKVTLPVTLSESFHYFQSDNDCPGIHNSENTRGNVSDASGMDFVLKFDLKLITVYKEVVDESGNPLNVDESYTYTFDVDKSMDSKAVSVEIDKGKSSGFGVEQVTEISEITLTEQTPQQKVVSGGQTYTYLRTEITANGSSDATAGLTKTANNISYFIVKNYYEGKPLEIEKKWYENDGTEITDADSLPESITGTLYQQDHVDADPGKKADSGVTLTVQAYYPYSYSGYNNYMYQTKTFTYTVATGGSFSGYVYGYYSQTYWGTTTNTERTISGISVTSGDATVSNSGNTISIQNITKDTTVRVTYSDLVNNAPVMNDPDYDKPDQTVIPPTEESTQVYEIPFELTAANNWKRSFTAAELNEQSGHTYKYWVVEDNVPGFSTSVTYDSASNALIKTSDSYQIKITNTRSKPLVVVKKWFNNDGSEINDTSSLDEITGTLYQNDYIITKTPTTDIKEYTLTVQAYYRLKSGSTNTYPTTTLATVTIKKGGTYSAEVIGKWNSDERSFSSVTMSSGSATVSNSGSRIMVQNITADTTVLVTYDTGSNQQLSEAPSIENVVVKTPQVETTETETPTSDSPRKIGDFTLSYNADSTLSWRKEFSASELNEQSGHRYTYYVSEVSIPGYTVSIDYDGSSDTDGASKSLSVTDTNNTITISNTKGYELPDTGGGGALPYELGGSAALLSSMLVGYSRRRRDRKEGET